MTDSLTLAFQTLLKETPTEQHRFLYNQFNLKDRLTGLVGARGVGKTTLMLQYIKEHFADNDAFYFSADHITFSGTRIYYYIEEKILNDGIKYFFIDEVHKYKDWAQEIKNLYDAFPKLHIVFSGSSSLDLIRGAYDLSRRAKMYKLPGMSFREYLNFKLDLDIQPISFNHLVNRKHDLDKTIALEPKILGHFKTYLREGYYPFYTENAFSYHEKILRVIDKTIYEDVANFYTLRTDSLAHLKKILTFLVSIPPGNTNLHSLAKNLNIDDKTAANFLLYLKETGLIQMVYPAEHGNQGLRRPDKLFLANSNLQFALEGKVGTPVNVGNLRELYFIQAAMDANLEVFHSKQGDFRINDFVFEIGGKNKTHQQIKDLDQAYLVKDDILVSSKHTIPLMYFGFLY